jgi:hypothetical protein
MRRARDGPNGDVPRAMSGWLEQIEGRVERDPLRQERTPRFDLALVAAAVARPPTRPSRAPTVCGGWDGSLRGHRRGLLLGADGRRPDPGQRRTATEVPLVSYRLCSATVPPARTCLSSLQPLHRP